FKELGSLFNDYQDWKHWIRTSLSDRGSNRFSSILTTPIGNQLSLEIVSKQLEVDGKQYVMFSFQNISEKVTLEKDLEESSNLLKNLTEQVPGGLYQLVLDSEGKMNFSFLSKGLAQVLGLKKEEIANFTDISMVISRVHPMDLPQVIMSSIASAKKVEPWQCQFRVKSDPNSEEYRWILGAARPQTSAHGEMVW